VSGTDLSSPALISPLRSASPAAAMSLQCRIPRCVWCGSKLPLQIASTSRGWLHWIPDRVKDADEGEAGSATSEETVKAATAAASNLLIKAEIEPVPKLAVETSRGASSSIVFV
jgi:hypothetical protein